MPARSAQNVSLTPELQKLIAGKVASGHYRSASEVVRAALRYFAGADEPAKVTGVGVDSETELVTILEGIGEGFYSLDRDFRITRYNSVCTRHFGKTPQEVIGRVLWDVFPGATDTPLGRKFAEAMKSRARITGETPSVIIPNRWLAYRLFPLGDGMGIVFNDVTDRKSAEEHRELLIHELNHRVKNTLATVQSMAAQTLRNAGVDGSVQETLESRLMTLSNVHSLLTNENWESAELRDVVWASLRPHVAPNREPFQVAGPDIRLHPKSAVIVSMALHELSTNAIKYGALSVDSGRINLDWAVSEGRFSLRWQEQGGPAVVRPARTGFGSRLIERGLSAELRGRAAIDYRASGVVCTIDAPIDAVRDSAHP